MKITTNWLKEHLDTKLNENQIIDKLTELQMNVSYPAIRELYKQLSQFIRTGEDMKIKIPFPEFSRKIKGELSNAPYIPCWVK